MKQVIKMAAFACMIAFAAISCKKKPVESPSPLKLLTAKTWRVEEVTNYINDVPYILYNRKASNNEEDFSLIRHTYKENGTMSYIDENGEAGGNGQWQLLENNTRIKLSMPNRGLPIIGTDLKLTAGECAYTVIIGAGYTHFKFTPVP